MDNETAITLVVEPNQDDKLIHMWLSSGNRHSEHTQRSYRHYAYALLEHAGKPLQALAYEDVIAYLDTLQDASEGTQALATNVLKSLFTWASELRYVPVNLGKALKPPKPRDELAQRILSEEDTLRLIEGETNPRNHAMLRLMYHAGLRVSEVVGLTWADVRETTSGAVLDIF